MVDTRVLGVIAAILGVIGMANYGVDLQNLTLNSILSVLLFVGGLYFALKKE